MPVGKEKENNARYAFYTIYAALSSAIMCIIYSLCLVYSLHVSTHAPFHFIYSLAELYNGLYLTRLARAKC